MLRLETSSGDKAKCEFREGSRLDVEVVMGAKRQEQRSCRSFCSRSDVASEQGNIDAVLFSAVSGDLVSLGSTQVINDNESLSNKEEGQRGLIKMLYTQQREEK